MTIQIKKPKTVSVEYPTTITIERGDIIAMLKAKGYDIPDSAEIFVTVPGGGDWSNMDLDISNQVPIQVRYKSVETIWTKQEPGPEPDSVHDGVTCRGCGCPITDSEYEDNGGYCSPCAAKNE